jgi:hypothetical protein
LRTAGKRRRAPHRAEDREQRYPAIVAHRCLVEPVVGDLPNRNATTTKLRVPNSNHRRHWLDRDNPALSGEYSPLTPRTSHYETRAAMRLGRRPSALTMNLKFELPSNRNGKSILNRPWTTSRRAPEGYGRTTSKGGGAQSADSKPGRGPWFDLLRPLKWPGSALVSP